MGSAPLEEVPEAQGLHGLSERPPPQGSKLSLTHGDLSRVVRAQKGPGEAPRLREGVSANRLMARVLQKKKKGPLPEASGPETFPHVIRLPAGRTRVQVRFYVLNRLAGVLGLTRRLRQRQGFLLGPRARASGPSACIPCRRGELGLGLGLGSGGDRSPAGTGHRDAHGRVGGLPGCRCPTRSGGGVCGPSPRNTSESSQITRLLWCEGSCGGDAACEASSRGCAFPTRAWVR